MEWAQLNQKKDSGTFCMVFCQEPKIPTVKNSYSSFYDSVKRLDLFQGNDNSAHIFWQKVKYSDICIDVCQEQKWVLGRLFLSSSEETSKCCCQQITAQGTGTLLGPRRRMCSKATETKYLVSSNSHRKLRLFKGSVGFRCIFSSVWKFRIAQDQQLLSIQFDMLKSFLSSITNFWKPMTET